MLLKYRSAVLSLALLSFTAVSAAPAQAQLVSVGHGTYLASNQLDTLEFTYYVTGVETGTVQGYAVWRGPNSTTIWKVSSFTFTVDGDLAFAGPIVKIFGTPPAGYAVGLTAFTVVKDSGAGDEIASISVVPPPFGNPPIQLIIAALGAPPFRSLLGGFIWIR